MQAQPSQPAPKRQTLPCPAEGCENGMSLLDRVGGYRGDEIEPFEYRATCETCHGEGVLDSWTCCCCTRDHDSGDGLPKRTDADGAFWCADCVRADALDGWDFAKVACTLRELRNELNRSQSIDTPTVVGKVCGELKWLADRFAELARDLGETR